MTFVLVPNKTRGLRLMVDKKHVKTIPKTLVPAINPHTVEKLAPGNKRLSVKEKLFLRSYSAYEIWKAKLYLKGKPLFELIKNAIPVQKNHVLLHSGGERLELLLDNKLKVNVPDKVYHSLLIKETTYHSNF